MHPSRIIYRAVVGALILVLLVPVSALGIARDVVVERGKVWVVKKTPYSQTRYARLDGTLIPTSTPVASAKKLGYRTDCSGFVSMCLDLKKPGLATATFRSVLTTITKDELLPGDVILRPSTGWPYGHAVLFVRWADAAHTSYWSYEESGSSKGTVTRLVKYPFFTSKGFKPYRYKEIDDFYPDTQDAIYGTTAYETAVAATRLSFPATSTAAVDSVVLTNGDMWTGNLGAAALAGAGKGPLLLTSKTYLSWDADTTIRRLRPKKVYVMGGPSIISKAVTDRITGLGFKVVRLTGNDRYITSSRAAVKAVKLARADGRTVDTAYLVASEAFCDGVAASPIAAGTARPILLTRKTSVPAATFDALKTTGIKRVYIVGSTYVVSESVVKALRKRGIAVGRRSGKTRYETALSIAQHGAGVKGAGLTWNRVGVSSGTALSGALTYGVAQGQAGSLLLFTPGSKLYSGASTEIARQRAGIGKVRVYGGYNVIGLTVRSSIAKIMRAQ